jgi:WD40 repeat protein
MISSFDCKKNKILNYHREMATNSKKNYPALYRTLQGHNNNVKTLSFNSNTSQLLSACHDNNVYLWYLNKATIKASKLAGHSAPVTEVCFSPSSSMFASSSFDHTIRVWNNSSVDNYPNNVIRSHTACVTSIDFSCDSRLLVSGSHDKTVKIFNVTRDEPFNILGEN